ncbi:DUF1284 domain-containing protein [Alicyclobacillus sp. SO9]|uniref:DUF1284 domain-containing protein n=1 Tax=Alicyclobacillus sp. SO9 TaxID=2665646 RepID=UPI0018E6FDCF|nr:DUF1284 domain-containing protein [Alicyclobacillus sp. SO9]QQE78982.1 DUF1284 domain-containing protein [Alicyclobacillus sp. SO9]
MLTLRGHHLLCLPGYRGMGYSAEYEANMTKIHQLLRREPETEVTLVSGPDSLCAKFPSDKTYHCEDNNIYERDANVLSNLNLEPGQKLPWSEIEPRIAKNVVGRDINSLCSTCSWRSYGVCEEGINEIRLGKGLRRIEID